MHKLWYINRRVEQTFGWKDFSSERSPQTETGLIVISISRFLAKIVINIHEYLVSLFAYWSFGRKCNDGVLIVYCLM